MISFWISVVPPQLAMTGVRSVDSRVSGEFLPFTKKIGPVTSRCPGQLSPDPSPEGESALAGTAVSHSSPGTVITPR
jgi:hypothetical protein